MRKLGINYTKNKSNNLHFNVIFLYKHNKVEELV